MPEEPTNAVLLAKMEGLRELFEEKFKANLDFHARTNEHLKKLNGQTAKNTRFRVRSMAYMSVAAFGVTVAVNIAIKAFF